MRRRAPPDPSDGQTGRLERYNSTMFNLVSESRVVMCDLLASYRLYLYKIQAGGIWPKVRASWPSEVWPTRSWPKLLEHPMEHNNTSLINDAAPVSAAPTDPISCALVAPLMRIRTHEPSREIHESLEDESSRSEHSESMSVRDMRQCLASPPCENKSSYEPLSGGSHSTWPPTQC